MNSLLPVSVIVPTRNCKKELEIHLEKLDYLWNSVPEIICVDGSSTDGTFEVLEKFCKNNPKTKLLKLPPGLYEGWNAGVQLSTQKYIYFSTIGDCIYQGGLETLVEVAEKEDVHLVISPPRMLNTDKETSHRKKWPIHYLCEFLPEGTTIKLSREEIILFLHSLIPSTLIGSSASNLYHGNFLKKHPFPSEFSHAGDTAWGVVNSICIDIVILSKTVADFQIAWDFLEKDARIQRDFYLKLVELSNQIISNYNNLILKGFLVSIFENKLGLWDWLASQAELAKQHEEILEYNRKMAEELNRRVPERIYRFLQRLFSK